MGSTGATIIGTILDLSLEKALSAYAVAVNDLGGSFRKEGTLLKGTPFQELPNENLEIQT